MEQQPNFSLADLRRSERQMTKVFKALSDSTRQQILRLLEDQQRSVGDIVSNFELSQPTISRHLSVLKEAERVIDRFVALSRSIGSPPKLRCEELTGRGIACSRRSAPWSRAEGLFSSFSLLCAWSISGSTTSD
jgi:DNA-binding transcriptional ArsR family regulator